MHSKKKKRETFYRAYLQLKNIIIAKIKAVLVKEPNYRCQKSVYLSDNLMLNGLEVTLSDNATGLPIGDAQLKADKYYFTDLQSFDNARSVDDANEIQEGIDVRAVFGDTGRYEARQVVADGIYGYRIYGNVSYFGVANVTIDSTVFCTASDNEGNNTKGLYSI